MSVETPWSQLRYIRPVWRFVAFTLSTRPCFDNDPHQHPPPSQLAPPPAPLSASRHHSPSPITVRLAAFAYCTPPNIYHFANPKNSQPSAGRRRPWFFFFFLRHASHVAPPALARSSSPPLAAAAGGEMSLPGPVPCLCCRSSLRSRTFAGVPCRTAVYRKPHMQRPFIMHRNQPPPTSLAGTN